MPRATTFALARYNSDGSLDTTFGSGGKVSTDFAVTFDVASSVAIQADGKIVAAGGSNTAGFPEGDFALARYNTDGSLDTSFGTAGKVTTDLFGFFGDLAFDVVIQADGKIVAVGQTVSSITPDPDPDCRDCRDVENVDFGLVRYNPDGSLDSSFGTGGIVATDFGAFGESAFGVAIQADGKIVVVGVRGFTTTGPFPPTTSEDFALARYLGDTDVAIISVTSNLPLPNSNTPLQLSATVANTGSVDIASLEVMLFLDLNSNLVPDTGEPSQLTTVTNLLVGTSQTAIGIFSNPTAGSYLGVAVADPANLLAETNENNNVGSTPLVVSLPDLTVTNLSKTSSSLTPTCSEPGGNNPVCPKFNVNLLAHIANIGEASASNLLVQFAFSVDMGLSFTNIGGPVNVSMIQPGQTIFVPVTWMNVKPGNYQVKVTVDSAFLINELSEANNMIVVPVGIP